MGSIWFMPVYLSVLPFCMFVISIINEKSGVLSEKYILQFFLICMILFIWSMMGRNYYFLTREILFYSMFFLLGFILKDKYIKRASSLIVFLALTIGLAYIFSIMLNVDITNLQTLKFPPHIVYFLVSLLAILFAVYFKGKLNIKEKNPFVWVGKNAIWFYFGQGISSTLIYQLVAVLQCSWYIKLPICIIANIGFAVAIVIIVKNMYIAFNFFKNKLLQKFNVTR